MMPRGWTLLLSAYLLVWVPIGFANTLFSTLPSIGRRGAAAFAELVVHGVSAAACGAAGWMLFARHPAAPTWAIVAVLSSGLVAVQSVFWTALPSQVAPGQRLPLAALSAGNALFWVVLITHYARRPERPKSVNADA